ncbi:MAG: RimK family protein [Deltaproteobacteria bacterium]|nr:MAG: RimK family protein [Deltaproteobacteria bacterium]
MIPLVVVENIQRFPLELPDAEVVTARGYLTESRYFERRGVTVFNLCRTYGYETVGYYVSLLAEARGHRPLPSVATLQDLRISPVVRIASEELEDLIERNLAGLRSERFDLSVYFGRNLAKRYDRLSRALFNQFPVPLLRASFARSASGWEIRALRAIATGEIPESHRDFVVEQARRYFGRRGHAAVAPQTYRYDLAILTNPDETDRPSDDAALRRFVRAAERLSIEASLIGRDDYGCVPEFDALFIRETTAVDHYTYRFARRAAAAGLVVVDDPESIVRCSNKVYQAELFARHGVACPETLVVHADNRDEVEARLGFPCVLKVADGAFSRGIVKIESAAQLDEELSRLLAHAQLLLAQRWVPSDFDWRIGVLDRRPLYACRYHMARGDWRIATTTRTGHRRYGRVEALPLEEVPEGVVALAARAAGLIGDGLYGVDVKEVDGRPLVIEINDNPNIDAGYEDAVLGEALYREIMRHFLTRLEARGVGRESA